MNVLVFGNIDLLNDSEAIKFAKTQVIENVSFQIINPNEDIPVFQNTQECLYILDVIQGITSVKVIDEKNLPKIILSPRNSAHDYDLAFQLKYLIKIGKISKFKIIGLPYAQKIDYSSIH